MHQLFSNPPPCCTINLNHVAQPIPPINLPNQSPQSIPHSIGLWKTVTLKELIEALDALGYDCYYEGTPTLTRITGCWVDDYEIKNWCVLC